MVLAVVNSINATGTSVHTVTTGALSITANNLIVVGTSNFNADGLNDNVSVTDSVGNTYTLIGSSTVTGSEHVSLWYAKNVTGGASVTFTYNVTPTQSDFPRIYVLQISGADTTAPLDQSGFTQSVGAGTTLTSQTITTTVANEILVAIASDSANTQTVAFTDAGAATGGWTKDQATSDATTLEGAIAHAIVSSTGAYAALATVSASANTRHIGIASFKAATGGSMTAAGPNSAATLPSDHSSTVLVTLTGTSTSWGGTTVFTATGLPTGWAADTTYNSGKAYLFTTTTAATMRFTVPAVATPPAGATGTITITESVTGTASTTIAVATPTLGVSPSSAIPSAGATSLTFTGTNTLWQGDNPQFTATGVAGTSIGASTATTNTASTATLTVGATTGTVTLTDPSTGASTTFQVTSAAPGTAADTNVFFSPYTWYSPGGGALQSNNINAGSTYAVTNCMGAYVKFKANCTGVSLNYDNTLYVGAGDYPIIMYAVDDGAFTTYQLASGDAGVKALATGLSAGVHTFTLFLKSTGSTTSNDRWLWTTAPYLALKITSFTITGGTGATSAVALRSKRAVFFGDSITEGLHAAQGDTTTPDATSSYVSQVAAALNAEYGQVGFNGSGWEAAPSNINSTKFHGAGVTAQQTWRSYANGKSRLVSSAFSPVPDYVFVFHGTNDGTGGALNATITADASDWLTQMLTAAPSAKVFLVLPAGRFKKTALSAAVLNSNQFYIDLDTSSPSDQLLAIGLTNTPAGDGTASASASWRAADGLHPNSRAHAEIAARLAQAVMNKIQPAGGGSGPVPRIGSPFIGGIS
jgi:lysophospholipase L1-like esterase